MIKAEFRVAAAGVCRSSRAGLDHHVGQRRSVRTADPTVRPRSVGSAVRTSGGAVRAAAGVMIKARAAARI